MVNIRKFNPAQFGLQGKRLAVVELNTLLDALTCICSKGSETLVSTLKSRYQFSMIPVMMDEGQYQGVPLVVVDADGAEKAFQYVRENASPELLAELKENHEFELKPIDNSSTKGFIAKCVRFVLGVALMMLLVSTLTGCAEAPAAPATPVPTPEPLKVLFEDWGVVKATELVRKTKRNEYHKMTTTTSYFREINVLRFPGAVVQPGDAIGLELRLNENSAFIKLCKNSLCVPYSVCYRSMMCFEKYEAAHILALNREKLR